MATEPPVFTTGKTGSTGSTPFFIVPAHPPVGQGAASASRPSRAAITAYHNRNNASCTQPSARLQQRAPTTASAVTAPAPAPIIVDAAGSVSYKAPAHKHAHHLHSIPPREKTAKTLILDHMLWQHTRARFLQARSELGLPPALPPQQQQLPQTPTSPTPPTSPSLARRGSGVSAVGSLPDLDDEGEDADIAAEDRPYSPLESFQLPETTLRLGKDVEDDIRALKFGVRGIERIKAYLEHHAEDDWYAARVDLDTARVQRATAEGMEKVLASLLTQSFAAAGLDEHHEHQHHGKDAKKSCFCHDVRMRIALSGLVNDFFARDHSVIRAVAENAQGGEEEHDSDYQSQHVAIDRAGVIAQSPMSISSLVTSRSPTSPVNTSAAAGLSSSAPSSDPTTSASSSRPPPHAHSVSKVAALPGSYRDPPLPNALYTLLPVSSYTLPKHVTAPFTHSPSSLSASTSEARRSGERRSLAPPNSIFSAVPRGSGPDLPWTLGPGNGMGWLARVPAAAAASDAAARGGDASLAAGNNGPWQGRGQTSRVWKPIGRSRELFNGGVSRGQQAQQRQPPSRSRLGASSSQENDAPLEREIAAASGKAAVASAVGRAACPRHLRETDECPRTCIHATHFSSQLPPSTATTAIGAGLAPAGLPLRRPPSVQSAMPPSRSRSRSRSIPRSVAASAYFFDGKAPARTSLSPEISSATLGGHDKNIKNIQKQTKQGERQENKRKAQAQEGTKAASVCDETPMTDILPRFLRFSALIAKELGREARGTGEQSVVDAHTYPATAAGVPETTTTGSASLAKRDGSDGRPSTPRMEKPYHRPPQHGKDTTIATGSSSSAKLATMPIHLQPSTTGDARPTRAWYALLCGIITRAVLEGYIRGRWKGPDPLEVLFGLGLGTTNKTVLKEVKTMDQETANNNSARASNFDGTTKKERKTTKQDVVMRTGESESEGEDEADSSGLSSSSSLSSSDISSSDDDGEDAWSPSMSPSCAADPIVFEPDGMPSLEEAVHVLFARGLIPSSHGTSASFPLNSSIPPFVSPATAAATSASNTDPEWEWETSERISEFATISLNSPDLLTHLQELSRRYPPEPVERAALRFFESVAEWRGSPELEAYKARRAQATATMPFTSKIASEQARVKVEEGSTTEAPESNNTDERERSTSPSPILQYFHVPKELQRLTPSHQTPASTPSSGGIGSSKKRGATEDATASDARTTKNARSDTLMIQDEIEPGWTRPRGV